MVPNPTYSGPVKPTIKKFKEVPFTSDSLEFNALVGRKLTSATCRSQDITAATSDTHRWPGQQPPPERTSTWTRCTRWAINYFPYNFNSTGDNGNAGSIFNQLYFRQAMQDLVDQPLFINKVFKGYGVPTYGPVPVCPTNPFASSLREGQPLPVQRDQGQELCSRATAGRWCPTAPPPAHTRERRPTSAGR